MSASVVPSSPPGGFYPNPTGSLPYGDKRRGKGPFRAWNGPGGTLDWSGRIQTGTTIYGYAGFIAATRDGAVRLAQSLWKLFLWIGLGTTLTAVGGWAFSIVYYGPWSYPFFVFFLLVVLGFFVTARSLERARLQIAIDQYRVIEGGRISAILECTGVEIIRAGDW